MRLRSVGNVVPGRYRSEWGERRACGRLYCLTSDQFYASRCRKYVFEDVICEFLNKKRFISTAVNGLHELYLRHHDSKTTAKHCPSFHFHTSPSLQLYPQKHHTIIDY
jgi:hypothetical protein